MYLVTPKQKKEVYNNIDAMFETGIIPDSFEPHTTDNIKRTYTTTVPYGIYYPIFDTPFIKLIQKANALFPNPEEHYYEFKIPKRTHGFRQITAPNEDLKNIQLDIARSLRYDLRVLEHDSAWAYIPGRDVVHAMQEHINNKSRWYLKIDLKDFFGSCNRQFIKQQLTNLYPFNRIRIDVIDKMLNLALVNDKLPQGTPLSPILTNLIMVEYDYKINKLLNTLANENKIYKQRYIYTRYADDIIISGKISFDYKKIIKAIELLLEETPLKINKEKIRYGSNAGRNWNLGIMCNKDNKLTIGHKRKHQLKTLIYNYIKDKESYTLEDLYYLQGQLSWLYNVESSYCKGLLQYFENKYNINVWQDIKQSIKDYINN